MPPQVEPHWTQYMTALMTPLVAAIAAYVAWKQSSIARNKLKLDLFDRRFAVYDAAKSLIGHIAVTGGVSEDALFSFDSATKQARWLLNEDLDRYLNTTLYEMARLHRTTISELSTADTQELRVRLADRKATQRDLLLKQMAIVNEKFSPFLQLGH
jgi:hypothetical protein